MAPSYPAHLLARESAPPYEGEEPFALWHFSEDASLERLVPHRPATNPTGPPRVWAVDSRHAPLYWFPRDCPRGCFWPVSTTTAEDRERFFGPGGSLRVHAVEGRWIGAMASCRLYAYRLPIEAFAPDAVGGYWTSDRTVDALERVVVDDLVGRHARAGIELRVLPSLAALWPRVVASSVEYSGVRLRNAAAPVLG